MDDKFRRVMFDRGPDGAMEIMVSSEPYMSPDGFGRRPHVYPVTIVQARYNGMYEGGPLGAAAWLCFPVPPHKLAESRWAGWCASDIPCSMWWDQAGDEGWPVGRGTSPGLAYADLIRVVCAKAGVDPASLAEAPSWPQREGEDDATAG